MSSAQKYFVLLVSLLAVSCSQQQEPASTTETVTEKVTEAPAKETTDADHDSHSYAKPDEVEVTHLDLDLNVDFEQKILAGRVDLQFERKQNNAQTLVLDTKALTIKRVFAGETELTFNLAEADPVLGAALEIQLPETGNSVSVEYQTDPGASGVQWLSPVQTAGGKHPFLFTQAQAIHARSFIPLQDSPKVRVTYNAIIRTPADLLAVMSAANDPNTERDGVYEFTMPQPIPSYLIALAVGDLQFQAMGARTGVYSEPYILAAAAAEFADTEAMLEATEARYGEYQWGRYDLLILPPSFPFGGMENPRLSFITPTVIAGDKSLVALIAHELAHSWSGNSTSNATWRDLWLNEGFTTYLTYRIMEIVFGTDRFNMEAVLGYQDLLADIEDLEERDEILAIDLSGRDPDKVFSNIPYEKGALFLRELEQKVGRENFDRFLLDYFEKFAFQSITTSQFIDYLETSLLKDYPEQLSSERIQQWIFEPGIPAGAPIPTSNAFAIVDAARSSWLAGETAATTIDTQAWTVHEWLYFLNNLPDELSTDQLAELDNAFDLTASKNNEIAHSWLLLSIKNWYEPALPRLRNYLVEIGRNKLVKPLYRELANTEEGKALGRAAFEKAKAGYHPLTVKANQKFVE